MKCPHCNNKDIYKTLARPFHNRRCNNCGEYFRTGKIAKRYGIK